MKEVNKSMKTIKSLKQGEYFTLKQIEEPKESQVYVKGDYDRSMKMYSCYKFDDVNSRFVEANITLDSLVSR
jgi:hypothetical protein